MQRPQVFSYDDYPTLLFHLIAWKKQHNRIYSYEYIARRLGVQKGHLANIVHGRRNIPSDLVEPLLEFLELHDDEREFVRVLIGVAHARTPEAHDVLTQRLGGLRQVHDTSDTSDDPGAVYRHWALPVVHEMASLDGFEPTAAWVVDHAQIPLTTDDAA